MEIEKLKKEFAQLYNGSPWIDVSIHETLINISPEKAFRRIAEGRNTIWEILNHMIEWRRTVLKRLNGEENSAPKDNFFREVLDSSEEAWRQTLSEFEQTQQEWLIFFDGLRREDLQRIYPQSGRNF